MDRRSITFLLLSTLIIFGWITAEAIFFPPVDQEELVERLDAPTDETESEDDSQDDSDPSTSDSNSENNPEADNPTIDDNQQPESFQAEHRWATLGSLAPDSQYRMLVILNSRGATIHRIELADRKSSGEYRFKHVDDRAGYLGNLALEPSTDGGLTIGIVPPGTPAQQATTSTSQDAGLKPGDRIVALTYQGTDTPLETPEDYFRVLNSTDPGQQLGVTVRRDDQTLGFTATLTRRPMEVVQPLPKDELDPELLHPESFLFRVGTLETGLWDSLSDQLETADWELVPSTDPNLVEFRYVLTKTALKDSSIDGPLTVFKRFRLEPRTTEDAGQIDRSFHVQLEIEIRNEAPAPQRLAFQLDGPTGLPDEGWWYTNKIHGRSSAIFYTAGVRDIIASSQGDPYRFYGGPEIVSNAMDEDAIPLNLVPISGNDTSRTLIYAGVDAQYFNCTLLTQNDPDSPGWVINRGIARPAEDVSLLDGKKRKLADISFRLTSQPIELPVYDSQADTGAYRQSFTVFAGPKQSEVLEEYGLSAATSYGWFAWFSRPLVGLLHLFYSIVGNYGISIIMLTLLVRGAMIPISRKAALNAQMMQHLQPEMKRINEQYKTDMEKRAKAQRELFARHNYNPMGGCLLMFIQLPIFLGLYRGLSVDFALRDQSLIPGLQWCSNLAGPDRLFYWGDFLPFLTSETGWLGPYFNVLPIITIGLFLAQQKLFMPPAVDEQTQMQQRMMTYMMIFMGLLFFKVPSGLCIYFITSSIWGIIERKLLPKPSLDAKLASMPSDGNTPGGTSPKKPSAAQQRIEEQRRRNRKKR